MGIPGILREIGKGERTALAKLAVEHLEKTQRPLRVAIDAAIWNFQNQAGQGGKNPALRTLFFRLLKLLALPIHPVFVYDGKHKPLTKRGRTVSRYSTCIPNETSKRLVQEFRFPHHTAPGEAEAECAFLQRNGVVDAVMSQDVDAIMFGSTLTLRDWSKEGTRGNKTPTHVNVLDSSRIKAMSGLDPEGMILVALLSGGDYDEAGVPGFGSTLACEIARAGFGADLLDLVHRHDETGLEEWRQRLQYELETNESGYFKRRHKTLNIPDTFPNRTVLSYYTHPTVSETDDLPALKTKWAQVWASEIDVPALRNYTADTFEWSWRSGASRFVRCFAQPLFQDRLRRGAISSSVFQVHHISERRQHFINDGIPELRLLVTPADVVGIDINAEAPNPDNTGVQNEDDGEDVLPVEGGKDTSGDNFPAEQNMLFSPSKKRMSQPWDPYTPERWWIPETLLQLGLPVIVEDWHQLQRDIRADPKRFATRKAVKDKKDPKQIDTDMQHGAIRHYFQQVGKPKQKSARSDASAESLDFGATQTPVAETMQRTSFSRTKSEVQDYSPSNKREATSSGEQEVESVAGEESSRNTINIGVEHASQRLIDVLAEDPHTPDNKGQMPLPSKKKRLIKPGSAHTDGSSTDAKHSPDTEAANLAVQNRPLPKTSLETDVRVFHTMPLQEPSYENDGPKSLLSDTEVSMITQRKPRRARIHPETPASPPSNRSQRPRPIESFFTQTKSMSTSDVADEKGQLPSISKRTTTLQQESTEQKSRSTASRRAAMARESLPGTWIEAKAERKAGKVAPRVSYVDLASD